MGATVFGGDVVRAAVVGEAVVVGAIASSVLVLPVVGKGCRAWNWKQMLRHGKKI